MEKVILDPTRTYKRQTRIAIAYMAAFVIAYLGMVVFALALTALCVYGAMKMIAFQLGIGSLLFGIGLGSMGIIVLFFLLKFVFKQHVVDRSGMYEIHREDEPLLFDLLESLVQEIGTHFPQRVYVSFEVNAGVFYDSSFWSLFLPIRKNLNIGLGLVNALSKEEFRSVLAHEFGHFAQKTMRVHSYTYHFEHITYNLLYDNRSYEENVQTFANISGVFKFFTTIAIAMIQNMQDILKVRYVAMQKAARGLSREMEFHADAVAVQVGGYEASKNALIRSPFASFCFASVLQFYQRLATRNQKSKNLLSDHLFAMQLWDCTLGQDSDRPLPGIRDLSPQRLSIENAWGTHPSTEQRIERMGEMAHRASSTDDTPASAVFLNLNRYQEHMADELFGFAPRDKAPDLLTAEESRSAYEEYFRGLRYPEIYQDYYYWVNPTLFDLQAPPEQTDPCTLESLFSEQHVRTAARSISAKRDMEQLIAIRGGAWEVERFQFDGADCTLKDCKRLIAQLQQELEEIEQVLAQNDRRIFHFFKMLEESTQRPPRLVHLYERFFDLEPKNQRYVAICEKFAVVKGELTLDEAEAAFEGMAVVEGLFKADIREMLNLQPESTPDWPQVVKGMEKYLSTDGIYLEQERLKEDKLVALAHALDHYPSLFKEWYHLTKRELLYYQAELVNAPTPQQEGESL